MFLRQKNLDMPQELRLIFQWEAAEDGKITREDSSPFRRNGLRAPAVEGKANVALRSFLAEQLSISERAIVIEHGYRSCQKLIRIEGLTEKKVRCRLLATG